MKYYITKIQISCGNAIKKAYICKRIDEGNQSQKIRECKWGLADDEY